MRAWKTAEARVVYVLSAVSVQQAAQQTVGARMPSEPSLDFGVVVALPLELRAVLRELGNREEVKLESGDIRTYHLGSINTDGRTTYRVAVTMPLAMGNVDAGLVTKALIERWRPRYVLMIGIAGGANPGRQHLGDVIVSDSILYYEQAKVRSTGAECRPQSHAIDPLLHDRVRNFVAREWRPRVGWERPDGQNAAVPSVHVGPIASGEKVVADSAFLATLVSIAPKLVGVEMESWGVASAARCSQPPVGFLAVRGICDFADARKGDEWQEYAAHAAAAWAFDFLRSAPIASRSAPDADAPRVPASEPASAPLLESRIRACMGLQKKLVDYVSRFHPKRRGDDGKPLGVRTFGFGLARNVAREAVPRIVDQFYEDTWQLCEFVAGNEPLLGVGVVSAWERDFRGRWELGFCKAAAFGASGEEDRLVQRAEEILRFVLDSVRSAIALQLNNQRAATASLSSIERERLREEGRRASEAAATDAR